uniref:Uncharacterized protein n=1 Tax=Oryza glumipatula TaxID=40148 RepID=A0A0D9Z410_9ORYZ
MLTARLSRQTPVKKLTHPRHHHAAPLRLLPPPPPPPVIKRVGVSNIQTHHRIPNSPPTTTTAARTPERPNPTPHHAPRRCGPVPASPVPPPRSGSASPSRGAGVPGLPHRRRPGPAARRRPRVCPAAPLPLVVVGEKGKEKQRGGGVLTAVLSGVVKKSPTRVQIQVTAVDRDRGGSEVVAGSEREEEGDIEGRSDPEASGGRAAKPAADGGVGAVLQPPPSSADRRGS